MTLFPSWVSSFFHVLLDVLLRLLDTPPLCAYGLSWKCILVTLITGHKYISYHGPLFRLLQGSTEIHLMLYHENLELWSLRFSFSIFTVLCFFILSLLFVSFLKINFLNFETVADWHAVERKNTEKSCKPFTHFLPVVTSCKIIARFHNQDFILIQSTSLVEFCFRLLS